MIRKCTDKDLKQLTTMKASSDGQNKYLNNTLKNGETKFEDCYVFEKEGKIEARAIIEDNYISLLTIGDLNLEEATKFIEAISKSGKMETVIYQDKTNFELIKNSLNNNNYKIFSSRERYEIYTIPEVEPKLIFRDLTQVNEEIMIQMFEDIQTGHLDISAVKESGLEYFNELKEMEFDPRLWFVAYQNDEPVGLIVLQKFIEGALVINNIGIIPKYRGQRLSEQLLYQAFVAAKENDLNKIIAEIDDQNFPMRDLLKRNGFVLENKLYFFEN